MAGRRQSGEVARARGRKTACACRAPRLEVARLRRRLPPLVVAAVGVVHRRLDQLSGIDAVQATQLHRDIGPADLRDVAALERAHTTMFAEQVFGLLARETVVAQRIRTRHQPELVRLYVDAPR